MARKVLWPVLAIGIALIVAPLAMSMPSKASDGEAMLSDFEPIMGPQTVKTTADYYDNVFVPLRQVVPVVSKESVARFQGYLQGIKGMEAEAPKLVPALAQALRMTPEQVQQFLGQQFPAMSRMLQGLPQMSKDFGALLGVMDKNVPIFARVPPGLDHYEPLVRTMEANVGNYKEVNSLPSFDVMPWFFIVPGILLVLLSGAGILSGRRFPATTA